MSDSQQPTTPQQGQPYATHTPEQGAAPPQDPPPGQGPSGYPAPPAGWAPEGDSTGGVIPYKNGPALVAYYLGIFALIPFLGALTGPIAFVLGIFGLQRRAANPAVKGSVHAWIGILLGGGFGALWISLILLIFAA